MIPQLGGSGIEQAIGLVRPRSRAEIENAALRHRRILHEFSTAVSAIAGFMRGLGHTFLSVDAVPGP
ncbi:MAG: hypothetical protein EBT08_07760 [Betaproteobacteria bacterium]|nr:hypothetical protein [Betaproteobacteria bacterium]